MNIFTFTFLTVVIVYLESRRRKNNKIVQKTIDVTKKEVQASLDILTDMLSRNDGSVMKENNMINKVIQEDKDSLEESDFIIRKKPDYTINKK